MTTRNSVALHRPVETRDERDWQAPRHTLAPVLIRVPDLSAAAGAARRRRRAEGRQSLRRKRRLRKEVRLVGSAFLLLCAPLAWSILTSVGPHHHHHQAEPVGVSAQLMSIEMDGPAFASASPGEAPRRVPRPVEPALATPARPRDDMAPVVLPGYVLPDDGSEEPAHAGS